MDEQKRGFSSGQEGVGLPLQPDWTTGQVTPPLVDGQSSAGNAPQPAQVSQAQEEPANISEDVALRGASPNPTAEQPSGIATETALRGASPSLTVSTVNPKTASKKKRWIIVGAIAGGVLLLVLAVVLILALARRDVSRTVMIYMVGSDLESQHGLASDELAGIDTKKINFDKTKVVLIAGGSSRWHNDFVSTDETSIFELGPDGFEKVEEHTVQNMGKQAVFANFLNYVTNNYKTDEYDLVMWNHGAALMGSEFDELQDDDNLELVEMRGALADSAFGEGKKLETVMFSTCLNGSLEMANVYKDYANYMVASEEVSVSYPGASDFDFIGELLSSDTGKEVGQKFVEKYQNKVAGMKALYGGSEVQGVYSTYSVMNLAKVAELNAAFDDFIGEINVEASYGDIARVRQKLYQYGQPEANYDMVDMYNLIEQLKDIAPVQAEQALAAVQDVVNYNYATDKRSRGISVYFPFNGQADVKSKFVAMYDEISENGNYNQFIEQFSKIQIAGRSSERQYLKNKSAVKAGATQADFALELTPEQAKEFGRANYLVFRNISEEDGRYLPLYKGLETKLEGVTLSAQIKGRQLMMRDGADDQWLAIVALESDNQEDYIEYETPVVLMKFKDGFDSASATVTMRLDKKTGKVGITKVMKKSQNKDLPGSVAVSLKDYDTITFGSSAWNVINPDGSYNENFERGGTIYGVEAKTDKLEFKVQESFDDGYDYYCVFRIWDVYGNASYSQAVKLK